MASVGNFDWRGKELLAMVDGEFRKRLRVASEMVKSRAVRLLSVSVFETRIVGYQTVQRRRKGQLVTIERAIKRTRLVRSKPGEPPRAETSTLRKSVQYEVLPTGKLVARVGTNVKYGLWLQLGVRQKRGGGWRIAPRPWLDVALNMEQARIARIMTRPLPRKAA